MFTIIMLFLAAIYLLVIALFTNTNDGVRVLVFKVFPSIVSVLCIIAAVLLI